MGGVLEEVRGLEHAGKMDVKSARERLAAVNCGLVDKGKVSDSYCLAVPRDVPALKRVFGTTKWFESVWFDALKQAPETIVIRGRGNDQVVKINGQALRCLLVDLDQFDAYVETGGK